jgi:excisionase family DNA binding protein
LAEPPEEWLRPHEIIERYGIGRTRLYTWLASGDLPSAKVGGTRHVRRADLEEFLGGRIGNVTA